MGMIQFSHVEGEPGFYADRPQPWRQGVTFQFDNKYQVSVQAGTGTYHEDISPATKGVVASAEVAVIAPDGDWATRDVWPWVFGNDLDDDVAARVSPDDLAHLLRYVANIVAKEK